MASALCDYSFVVLLTSRNGTPQDTPNCNELTDGIERCEYCIHSEKNLINFAAIHGISIESKIVVTTHRPCISCANDLVQVRIGAIYYLYDYISDGKSEYVQNLFEQRGIRYEKITMPEVVLDFKMELLDWTAKWTT